MKKPWTSPGISRGVILSMGWLQGSRCRQQAAFVPWISLWGGFSCAGCRPGNGNRSCVFRPGRPEPFLRASAGSPRTVPACFAHRGCAFLPGTAFRRKPESTCLSVEQPARTQELGLVSGNGCHDDLAQGGGCVDELVVAQVDADMADVRAPAAIGVPQQHVSGTEGIA